MRAHSDIHTSTLIAYKHFHNYGCAENENKTHGCETYERTMYLANVFNK